MICGKLVARLVLALGLVRSTPVRSLALLAAVADLPAGRALHQLHGRTGLFAAVRALGRGGIGGFRRHTGSFRRHRLR
jgi:hypothetical protein